MLVPARQEYQQSLRSNYDTVRPNICTPRDSIIWLMALVFVYFILAAQCESWSLPLSVLAQSETMQLYFNAIVRFYKALGGGWTVEK